MPEQKKTADSDRMRNDLMQSLRASTEEVVAWFCNQMPDVYFQDTDYQTQLMHVRAMAAASASQKTYDFKFGSADGNSVTYIRPVNKPGVLAEVIKELPRTWKLRAAKIHTANDDKLVIVTFLAGDPERCDLSKPEQKAKYDAALEFASRDGSGWAPEEIKSFMSRCTLECVTTATPLRLHEHWNLWRQLTGTDNVHVELNAEKDGKQTRIVVASGNAPNRIMLERVAARLAALKVNINRAHLDVIDDGANGSINILGFVVVGPDGGPVDPNGELGRRVKKDLKRIRWVDDRVIAFCDMFAAEPKLNLTRAEVIVGLNDLCYQILVRRDQKSEDPAFSRDRISQVAVANVGTAIKIAELFLERFDPSGAIVDAEFAKRAEAIRKEIAGAKAGADYRAETAQTILSTMLTAVENTLRTNAYVEDRYALSMRVNPVILEDVNPDPKDAAARNKNPYGVYFVHGCEFNGFHVRFRDIARGGVRAVAPQNRERHVIEMARHYDECYGLASAQQLKNKDIPEGGAKAVILIAPVGGPSDPNRISRAVKAFADALIDLITDDYAVKSRIVDRLGKQELLYLGPDENITPDHIVWITERAKRRGYSVPNALMSSKPGNGINHKVYGVTSEGITVFLEVALKHCGIDPTKRPFTVKITGGPDGDVAGNEIRILDRNYGQNAKIVAIGDGTGVGEDPDGLDHGELLRLFREAKGISDFSKAKLGPKGRVVSVTEKDGEYLRNTMHNRIVSDVFVPGGGRPNTINDNNWKDFLTAEGKPSSPVIVEGANIFLTEGARRELTKLGVFIVKDSSANKCGVICSSFEIVACMLLDEKEFLAIKDQYVEQVLVRLRALARAEADLLVRMSVQNPTEPLFEVSKKVSQAIIKAADEFERAIDGMPKDVEPHLRGLVIDHLPPVLVEKVGDKLWTKVPRAYLKWMMAKSLAARIVYREGHKEILEMSADGLAKLAVRYLKLEHERMTLAVKLEALKTDDGRRAAQLLRTAGILTTLGEN